MAVIVVLLKCCVAAVSKQGNNTKLSQITISVSLKDRLCQRLEVKTPFICLEVGTERDD